MVTTGISTERNEPRNRKITTMTMHHRLDQGRLVTSSIEDWMNWVES